MEPGGAQLSDGNANVRKLARFLLPFAVTIGALWWVFARIGLGDVVAAVTVDVLWVLVPALLLFGAISLWIEAECLVKLLPPVYREDEFTRGTAARIKAASYPLALLHYAVGAGGLAILLGRRTGHTAAEATGIVALIALFDVGVQLLMMVAGVTALGTGAPEVRAGVAGIVMLAILAGFVGLRTPIALGPLDRIRRLSIFDAARTTPLPLLARLAFLRAGLAFSLLGLIGACCYAFTIDIPLTYLLAGVPILMVVSMVPSIAGLGTGQVAFIEVFQRYAAEETLLACSLTLSAGLIVLRSAMGLSFAREFTREAFVATRGGSAKAGGTAKAGEASESGDTEGSAT